MRFWAVMRWGFAFEPVPTVPADLLDKRRRISQIYLALIGFARRGVYVNAAILLYQYAAALCWLLSAAGLVAFGDLAGVALQLDRPGLSVLVTLAMAYISAQLFVNFVDRFYFKITNAVVADHAA